MSSKDDHGLSNALAGYGNLREMVAELEKAAGECTSQDDARERIQEDALEICVRTGWHSPTGDRVAPEEFYILLSTGGPALRIRGELNEHCEPSRAWLEYQDWGTPWTRLVTDSDGDTVCQATLLTYAHQFYFGEG